jgi:acetyl-CoA carboxylase biotin carboxylase subunit
MFHRLLIANRGEVAVRVANACRALGIAPVGVASEADRGAAWLERMDEVVHLGPAAARRSYLDGERVLQAAVQTGCTALHPGWGFLAEDPRFAALCEQHGVTFVGPPPGVIERMGRKSPARRAAASVGLAPVPGSDGPLPDADSAARVAAEVGYPVILKADSGGGGRGMRRCDEEAELREAFAAARAEAEAAFGDASVYLERYLEGGRHVEIQVLADARGRAIHLGERDCSVQRKHQKLVEESPCPVLDVAASSELGARAASAAAELGYVGAGTIEFMLSDDGAFHFLEMNTRLQVEHPVSELRTGIDLVEWQIRIAAGEALTLTQDDVRLDGAAIECRINAEDPSDDFRPSPGRLEAFELPADLGPGTVRVETHLAAGEEVSPHYDSLVAKLVTHAPTREEAIVTMERALEAARVEGVATTIPLHLAVLADPGFRAGRYDTRAVPGWPPAR